MSRKRNADVTELAARFEKAAAEIIPAETTNAEPKAGGITRMNKAAEAETAKAEAATETKKATRKTNKADEPRYTIRQDVHTKTNEPLWVVRCNVTLSREDYFKESDFMRNLGGYYSRYKHGFIFKADPTEKLA